ncbi:hypothetical protein [Inconstantimicrobium mannanitabidum]|uniref:Uncharacterized protein n=1 Tax=Inconstantimicrobium mannanitabidum TaxID=1604901 RepID=A0ACB5RF53_9CLOT|nr:hypothetical protein [Clostridium sp. TW13]GKX67775.1 hypothetical protein rsdtw13_30330 [Clostridium sp. TW13]
MKNLKRIIVWSLIAIIIQNAIFLYVENVYLSTDLKIKAEKVEDSKDVNVKDMEVSLKSGIENIQVSYNGRFASYMNNGKLCVLDTKTNEEKSLTTSENSDIVFYKWLHNDTNMIAIKKVLENGVYHFEPVAFDAKKGQERELTDFDFNKLKIPLYTSKDTIDDVVFSTATHSIYIKIKKSTGRYNVYYANVMNQLKLVKSNRIIGKIAVPTTSTNAVMEEYGGVRILNQEYGLKIPGVQTPKILGTDSNDNVYFGNYVDEKITKIYYGVISNKVIQWNELNLPTATAEKNILVDYSGKVYINDELKGQVTELTSNKTIQYKGKLLQTYSNGIISTDNNKLIKNILK